MFAGFDRLTYPGDDLMKWLWENTNFYWCGFYLAPAPSQGYTGWMAKRTFLKTMGWGLAPIYVGQQAQGPGSHKVTADQGTIDGANAALLAQQAMFPPMSVIHLDIEQGPPIKQAALDYYKAWSQAVFNAGYYPGVYCSYLLAQKLMDADARPQVWVFHLAKMGGVYHEPYPETDPSSSGVDFADVWQLAQGVTIDGPKGTLEPYDLDSADSKDPSLCFLAQ